MITANSRRTHKVNTWAAVQDQKEDIAGTKFCRLTAVEYVGSYGKGAVWLFRCDCGNTKRILAYRVKRAAAGKRGGTSSCGCLYKETRGVATRTTHGKRRTRIYRVWASMMSRCRDPGCRAFPFYGGRGITVCDSWSTFDGFYACVGDAPPEMTLDRIDNDGGYEPGNWRWATRKEQARNRRSNVFVEHNGRRATLAEWSEESGVPASRLSKRLRSGWPMERALTEPSRNGAKS